jgi:preprotein translocase subunit SecE
VARDRQRAKQRKRRAARNPLPRPTQPYRADLPGELEHAAGEVDEFDAALVRGAEGVPVPDDAIAPVDVDPTGAALARQPEPELDEAEPELDEPELAEEEDLEEDDLDDGELASAAAAAPVPAGARRPAREREGGNRFINFLRASWAELQRVQWPDRRQVGQATAVVLGFVIVAGAYLGIADALAQRIVNFIL